MKSRVLVLDAEGFVGRAIVETLLNSAWAIPVAQLDRPRPAANLAEQRYCDVTDALALGKAMQGTTAVVNCVGGRPQTIAATAAALVDAARMQSSMPRIVHLSSIAVYGNLTGVIDESTALEGLVTPYGAARIAAEKSVAACATAVILRPGIVYGPHSAHWTTRVGQWLLARRIGDLGVAGDGFCNLLYIDDLVQAVIQALQLPEAPRQIFNLCMQRPPTWNDYFVAFGRALGATPIRRVTRRRLKIETRLLAPPLKIIEVLGQRLGAKMHKLPAPIPPSLLPLFRQRIRMDVSVAEVLLLRRSTPLPDGISNAASWYKKFS